MELSTASRRALGVAALGLMVAAGPALAQDKTGAAVTPNAAGGIFDDSTKPAKPGVTQGTTFDDTIKPANPAVNPKQGGVIDDSTKPVPKE
jgi:hypothetical protein